MKKRKYIYFVSYAHELGFGRDEIHSDKKIVTDEQIKQIEDKVREKRNLISAVILYFSLLRTEDAE
jgi:hypothetical protein